VIRVERSFDPQAGAFVAPKSRAGTRNVPIESVLREQLIEHRLRLGRSTGLLFGRSTETPFSYTATLKRAARAWRDAKLSRIGLYERRQTFASLMIAAGVSAKALSAFMGHGSISTTLDLYGHLLPGAEDEAADMLDTYRS
jgi:integrase